MLPVDRTGSAPDPRLSWQPSTIPALNRVHIVAASPADDDTLSAMIIRSFTSMSCLQLARSRRIAIQFGEILLYIHTVSIGNRYICPFSHPFPVLSHPFPVLSRPFPHYVPPPYLSCPQPMLQAGELYCQFLRPGGCVICSKFATPVRALRCDIRRNVL